MLLLRRKRTADRRLPTYTLGEDLRNIFSQQVHELQLLALLLTRSEDKARKCVVSGLANCGDSTTFFSLWAHNWARRIVIGNAVRLISPRPNDFRVAQPGSYSNNSTECAHHPVIEIVLGLPDFERFVVVISAFDEFSDHDCSVMLDCSEEEVRNGRKQAVQHLAESFQNSAEAMLYQLPL